MKFGFIFRTTSLIHGRDKYHSKILQFTMILCDLNLRSQSNETGMIMEAELDAILLKIAQNEAMRDLKSHLFDESMELLQDIFGDEGITIEDWIID